MNTSNLIMKIYLLSSLTALIPFTALSQIRTLPTSRPSINGKTSDLKGYKQNKKPLGLKLNLEVSKVHLKKDTSNLKRSMGGTGVDGGGGNLRNGPPLTKKRLESYLANSRPYDGYTASVQKVLKYLFNGAYSDYSELLFDYQDSQTPNWTTTSRNIHKKLFDRADGVTIYSVLKSTEIKLQDDPCRDPKTGTMNDASADMQAGLICLSWSRLAGKLFTNNFESYLIPLLAHEYSHLVGTTEAEAEGLEDFLKSWVSFEKISMAIDGLEDYITNYTSQMPEALSELQKAALAQNPNAVCIRAFQLYSLEIPTDNYFYTIEGFFPLSAEEKSRVNTLWIRLLNLTKYCESINMSALLEGSIEPDDLVSIDYAFQGGSREITVLNLEDKIREFYYSKDVGDSELTRDQIKFLPIEGTITKVSDGNLQAVLSEVDKIASLLKWLRTETNVFEYPQLKN